MATVSFLASRASPAGGFWLALAGGLALARVAQRHGGREGYGASLAATLETVAIMGPARFGVPLTQAVTAPMLGRLEARNASAFAQWAACALVRLLQNAVTTAFFIWIIAGGLDAYAGTYETIGDLVGIDVGEHDALAITVAGLVAWAAFASGVQVWVYLRGLRRWEDRAQREEDRVGSPQLADGRAAARPGLLTLIAVVLFVGLLTGTWWPLLGAVALVLAALWLALPTDSAPLRTGLLLAAVLGGGAFAFSLGGGLGLEVAAQRAIRAALLVLVATWLRAAAGAEGIRIVSRRVLARLRRVPSVPEAAVTLDQLGTERQLADAARALLAAVAAVPAKPLPVIDAVLGWVAREAATPPARR